MKEYCLPHDSSSIRSEARGFVASFMEVSFFKVHSPHQTVVLELGCGYAHFINHVKARRRVAIDSWPGFLEHLGDGVEGHVGSVLDLSFLDDSSVDFAFASNLFEHLTKDDFGIVLDQLRRKLSKGGILGIIAA